MEEEKIQINIYQIDQNSDLFDDENKFEFLTNVVEAKGYSQQDLSFSVDGFLLKLFYNIKPQNPKWKKFLSPITNGGPITEQDKAWIESFIFLAQSNSDIYAITGGLGYFAIQEYINEDFGIDVISRLIKKEDKIIKATREKSVMGGILGSSKNFRKSYNLFENASFGKIYQELKASLDKDILKNKFGFQKRDLKKNSFCIAKASFKINKAITMDQLFEIVRGCEDLLKNNSPIAINNVEKIVKKRNQTLISRLEDALYNQLWQRYQLLNDYSIDFDLCHKEFDKYLTASRYVIKKSQSNENYLDNFEFEELNDIDELFIQIKQTEESPSNIDDFKKLISSVKIFSYDEDGNELTRGWLLHHIHGDVETEEKRYFYIDKNWYLIKDQFVNELNESCAQFIIDHPNDELTELWDYPNQSENAYNQNYLSKEKTLVLDKITPENIEACDILKWDDEYLFFYHVKAGFGNTMRDLCSQVLIAANRIKADKLDDKKYIKQIFKQMKSKSGSSDPYYKKVAEQVDEMTEEEFLLLFEKKFIFVLAIIDTSTRNRELKNMTEFGSNIAKFSLQELNKEMRGLDVPLEIAQIKKQ